MSTAPVKPVIHTPGAASQARSAEAQARSAADPAAFDEADTPEGKMRALKDRQDAQEETIRALMAANRALLSQVRATSADMPAEEVRPTVDAMMDAHDNGELDGPILCKEGWLVPRVTSSNPEQQLTAAALTALTGGTVAKSRESRAAAIEKGKARAVWDAEADAAETEKRLQMTAKAVETSAKAART